MARRRSIPALLLAWVASMAIATAVAGQAPSGPAGSPAVVPAATPPAGVDGPVDPRSSGEGPGLEAEPLLVLLGVVGLGVVAAGGTMLYVRVTRDD